MINTSALALVVDGDTATIVVLRWNGTTLGEVERHALPAVFAGFVL